MRDINPYKFLAIANGFLPAAIEHFSDNQKWNFASTTALLAPATIFAEDEYYGNTILSYTLYNASVGLLNLGYGLVSVNSYNDIYFGKYLTNVMKIVAGDLTTFLVRYIFNPVEDINKIDITNLEELINNETQAEVLNLESSTKVTTQKAASILDNYSVDHSHADNVSNLINIFTTYEYPDHTVHIVNKYAADSYNNHHDLDYGF